MDQTKLLERALRTEFASIAYVRSNTESLSEIEKMSLRHTALKYLGHSSVFEISKSLLEDFLDIQFNTRDFDIQENSIVVIRRENPIVLEYFGDIAHSEALWDYFDSHKFRKTLPFLGFHNDPHQSKKNIYAVLIDNFCSEREIEYFHIWDSHKEKQFGQSYILDVKSQESVDWRKKLDIQNDCSVVFYQPINHFLADKYKLDPKFIGKFTIDDFGQNILRNRQARFVMSQSYEELGEEADYRLIGGNIESTIQELGTDSAILFYKTTDNAKEPKDLGGVLDRQLKAIRDSVNENCQALSRAEDYNECDSENPLAKNLRKWNLNIFSFDLGENDIPSFVIDDFPTLLIFLKKKGDPLEFRINNKQEIFGALNQYIQNKVTESEIETDL